MPFIKTNTIGQKEIQVRACLAFLLTIGATAGFFIGIIPTDSYMPLVIMAVSWYFARSAEKDQNKPNIPPIN